MILFNYHNDYIYRENIGESVIYQWIECIRSFLQEKSDDERKVLLSQLENLSLLESEPCVSVELEIPEIIHGEIIADRKSIFQGHVAIVSNTQEVE